jgi:type II secretory pathway pseudopilin PulG
MKENTFRAQALAIVMVVLVIASIIGVSLFSRMSKNKQTSVNEQDSSIASTIVDSALDFFVGSDIEAIETVLGEDDDENVNYSYDSLGGLLQVLQDENIVSDAITIDEGDNVWCEGESSQSITMSYAEDTDYVEVQPGSVMAYNIEDVSATDPCQLGVRIRAVEDYAIFVVKKVYDYETEVSESISNYCMQKDSADPCTSDISEVEYSVDDPTFNTVSWSADDSAHILNLDFTPEHLVEIRILPIKGTIAVNNNTWSSGDSECIERQFKFIKITAEANCNDSYRGKQMFLPGSGCLGYSTLFDYGIYDTGMFQP